MMQYSYHHRQCTIASTETFNYNEKRNPTHLNSVEDMCPLSPDLGVFSPQVIKVVVCEYLINKCDLFTRVHFSEHTKAGELGEAGNGTQ